MSSKSKKPDPVPVSQGERDQAALAKQQIEHYRTTFAPLEGQFAKEAGRDYSSRLGAQSASAGMREATAGLQSMALSGAPADTAALGSAISAGRQAGVQQGLAERDQGRLEALGVGTGITADASKSLSEAGRIQTNSAIEAVRAELQKQQAKASVKEAAIGSAVSLAGAYGINKYMAAKAGSTPAYAGTPQSSPTSLNSAPQQLVAIRGKPIW